MADESDLTGATPREFADGILTVLRDKSRAAAIGTEARRLADTKYSYEAYLERTRQACATLFGLQGDGAANPSRRPVPEKEPVVKDLA